MLEYFLVEILAATYNEHLSDDGSHSWIHLCVRWIHDHVLVSTKSTLVSTKHTLVSTKPNLVSPKSNIVSAEPVTMSAKPTLVSDISITEGSCTLCCDTPWCSLKPREIWKLHAPFVKFFFISRQPRTIFLNFWSTFIHCLKIKLVGR